MDSKSSREVYPCDHRHQPYNWPHSRFSRSAGDYFNTITPVYPVKKRLEELFLKSLYALPIYLSRPS